MDWQALRQARAAWDRIAASFDVTRRRPWAPVLSFLDSIPRGALVFDAGTGNGRHAAPAAERGLRIVGWDVSRQLLDVARRRVGPARAAGWVLGAIERPPLKRNGFDAGLAVAVLHHVRGRAHREAALAELLRLLRPGGRLLVSVWSRRQPAFEDERRPLRPPAEGPVEPGDAMLRWTQHGLDVDRFVHLYEFDEFRREVEPFRPSWVWAESIVQRGAPDNFLAEFIATPGQNL